MQSSAQTNQPTPPARASLENNDAYNIFQPLGDLIITGPTNTNVNVNDVMLVLSE